MSEDWFMVLLQRILKLDTIPVALLLKRSTETVIAIYSVLRAGGFYVPIETEWPAERNVTIMGQPKPT